MKKVRNPQIKTNDSFTWLIRSWELTGMKLLYPYKFLNLLHMVFSWIVISLSPISIGIGVIKAMDDTSMTATLTNFQASLNVLLLPFKALVIAINFKRLRSVEEIFENLDKFYVREEERLEIKDCEKACRSLFFTFSIFYAMYGAISWLVSFFALNQETFWFPFIDWIPYQPLRHCLQFFFDVVIIHFLLQTNVTSDTFPATYIRALRTHIKLLTGRVSRLGTNSDFNDEQNFRELVACIASHQQILQVADIVGSILSLTIFLQLTFAAAILCVCMLNIFIFADPIHKVITIVYYLVVLMQTVPSCYQASMLEADCAKLPDAIFHCNWLDRDKRFRKLIIYFLHRAQREITFTGIKLFRINLSTNLSIAKFSFTLYTFINEMGFGKDLKERFE
ncbi:odorant receptor 7a-like [Bactrocera tryoni]|uniref:odorant receptor 7a-like n=1 Tax=Bactrocera tryoni TaxID=59916 RepID=UPI001A982BBF|nr:odorant receptor 7a-like [Bactrocera tryoni]